ncbi:uncharacterized protein LOC132048799 [Lycium ferocissimum]|uniref:uncharacterized protein LOC132048799 n=1 Tax=Lycium ferocissimum TaxID=112874 RepID=UPI0028151B80|nr:uncharacterized protein LOC132048799 [Lycium ferocissimum]
MDIYDITELFYHLVLASASSSVRRILVTWSLICHLFPLHHKLKSHQVQQPFLQLLVSGYHEASQAASPQKDSYGIHSYQKDHMFKVVEDWPPKLSILEFVSLRLISTRNIQLKNEMEDKHARSDKRWSKSLTPDTTMETGPFSSHKICLSEDSGLNQV